MQLLQSFYEKSYYSSEYIYFVHESQRKRQFSYENCRFLLSLAWETSPTLTPLSSNIRTSLINKTVISLLDLIKYKIANQSSALLYNLLFNNCILILQIIDYTIISILEYPCIFIGIYCYNCFTALNSTGVMNRT